MTRPVVSRGSLRPGIRGFGLHRFRSDRRLRHRSRLDEPSRPHLRIMNPFSPSPVRGLTIHSPLPRRSIMRASEGPV